MKINNLGSPPRVTRKKEPQKGTLNEKFKLSDEQAPKDRVELSKEGRDTLKKEQNKKKPDYLSNQPNDNYEGQ